MYYTIVLQETDISIALDKAFCCTWTRYIGVKITHQINFYKSKVGAGVVDQR